MNTHPTSTAEQPTDSRTAPGPLNRRAVLAATGVATASAALVVAGCSSSEPTPSTPAPSDSATPSSAAEAPTTGEQAPSSSAAAKPSGTALGATSDVPVGGGKIYAGQKVVVTQPTEGTYKAFSSICTHKGCAVTSIADGLIDCPCHGSKFKVTDGSVEDGPAKTPLPAKKVTAQDGKLYLS
ncbi:Rieske (2Fe-2S) protein [Pseudonocardia spinosispora]|uniref:Rieske (2Fe-2S) protein n=1 Tax=Pseudonocardia spinosispora TaxID=103441 RepID=UPI00041F2C88|nr:Rieske (2Fe-2S) protein [Pseudonocardia spinosispora]